MKRKTFFTSYLHLKTVSDRSKGNRMWGFTPHPTRVGVPQPQSTPWSLALPMLVSVDSFGFLRLSAAPSTGGPVASFTLDPFCGCR